MSPTDKYDPKEMTAKKKVEFERWYADNTIFNLRYWEMEAYCESDVKLLKAEFEGYAENNPWSNVQRSPQPAIGTGERCCFPKKPLLWNLLVARTVLLPISHSMLSSGWRGKSTV